MSPSDFGIVAMAMIFVDSLEIFNQTGQTLILIRLENPTQEHYNSAFTVTFDTETAMDETAILKREKQHRLAIVFQPKNTDVPENLFCW